MEVPEEELTWEVGAAFLGELEGEGDIQIKKVPEHEVVSTIFKGPYSETHAVYGELYDHAQKNGHRINGPQLESYPNHPNLLPESELLTEVQFPVLKQ
jgi:AraC family transcriptional regulator